MRKANGAKSTKLRTLGTVNQKTPGSPWSYAFCDATKSAGAQIQEAAIDKAAGHTPSERPATRNSELSFR